MSTYFMRPTTESLENLVIQVLYRKFMTTSLPIPKSYSLLLKALVRLVVILSPILSKLLLWKGEAVFLAKSVFWLFIKLEQFTAIVLGLKSS